MHLIRVDDVRHWFASSERFSAARQGIGHAAVDGDYLESVLGMPLHLRLLVEHLESTSAEPVAVDALASIPFYSLCRGLFLPLSGLGPGRAAHLFGLAIAEPPDAAAREALVVRFLERPIGLSLSAKLACVMGDPLEGRGTTFRRDSLLQLLLSRQFVERRVLLDRLHQVGDVAGLFSEAAPEGRGAPALTAA